MGVRETFWPHVKHLPAEERLEELRRVEGHLRAQAENMREARGETIEGGPQGNGACTGSGKPRRERLVEWVAKGIERVFTRRSL